MLATSDRPTAADLRTEAGIVLAPLLVLTPEEGELCDRLQHGELVPQLLFPTPTEIAVRVAKSPPLLWKAQNARAHRQVRAPTKRSPWTVFPRLKK